MQYSWDGDILAIEVVPKTKVTIDPSQSFYVGTHWQDGYIVKIGSPPDPITYAVYNGAQVMLLGYDWRDAEKEYRSYPGGFNTSVIGASATVTSARLHTYVDSMAGSGYSPVVSIEMGKDEIGAALDVTDWDFGTSNRSETYVLGWNVVTLLAPDTVVNKVGDTDFELTTMPPWLPAPDTTRFIRLSTAEGANAPYLTATWILPGAIRVSAGIGVLGSKRPVNVGGSLP